jgi:DUF4097 and DUF4098 domain-containing protein YvlB
MSKKTKIWLLTAACLVLLGGMLFVGGMDLLGWDFTKLESTKYETNSYAPETAIMDIRVTTKTADVILRPSDREEISVVCYEQNRAKHEVSVKDGVLEIRLVDERKWYDHIGIHFGTPKITLSIPQGQYGALMIRANTGKITVPKEFGFETVDISLSTGDVTCEASAKGHMKIKTTTGNISLQENAAATLELTASTGDLYLKYVTVTGAMSVTTNTGRVKLDGCDAGELKIKTNTGDVSGSLRTPKIFFTETDTGDVNVPKSTTGGSCEITTDTGDIHITLEENA